MSSRVSQTVSLSADANCSRRYTMKTERDAGAGDYQASTISFTAPATISDSANGFGLYGVNDTIELHGSPLNSRRYALATVSAGALTVVTPVITTESAGVAIIIQRDS